MKASKAVWLDLDEAIETLGRGYSRSSIRRKIDTGELVEGLHYCKPSPRTLKINVAQIMDEWSAA